ncbi:MAG: hypothetical protein GXO30_07670 [Epsilonproteobacteria bacterium]|nr:hypothetical protein [Campylobacterota bacterium]
MKILASSVYEKQLKEILSYLKTLDHQQTKKFKMYLDTIILNMPSKLKKYQKSIYFDDDTIKDIQYNGCTIPFLIDIDKNLIILLGITSKN